MNFEPAAPENKNWFKGISQTAAFFLAYFIFATIGIAVSVMCAVAALLFHGVGARRFGQEFIRGLFVFFVGYLRACGLMELDAKELSVLRGSRGLVVIANHPSLLDAVLLISQLPRAVCLMKGSLARNIVLSGTARLAGYIRNESGPGLIRKCEERLKEGANLLVFPEGTRTVNGTLHPFKMGFALIATMSGAPVQTVIITAESNYLGKGRPLFKKPALPVRYSFRLGKRFQPTPEMDAKHFGGLVENYFLETLSPSAPHLLRTVEKS